MIQYLLSGILMALALLQLLGLPGWAVLSVLDLFRGRTQRSVGELILYAFLVGVALNLGLYLLLSPFRESLFRWTSLLVLTETGVLFWSIQQFYKRYGRHWIRSGVTVSSEIRWVTVTAISLPFVFAFRNLGPLEAWDGALSWQRWALDFWQGRLPLNTWKYPQVIPMLWGWLYQLQGTPDFHGTTRVLMAAFPSLLLLAFFLLARNLPGEKRNAVAYVLLVPLVVMLGHMPVYHFADGLVDFAAILSCFLPYYFWSVDPMATRPILLSSILAANIKQGGMLWVVWALFRSKSWKERVLLVIGGFGWNAYKLYEVSNGRDQSESSWIANGLFEGLSPWDRAFQALIGCFFHSPVAILASVLLIVGWTSYGLYLRRNPSSWKSERLPVAMSLMYFLAWAFFFSYLNDPRNLSPILGLVWWYCFQGWVRLDFPLWLRSKVLLGGMLMVPLLGWIVLNSTWVWDRLQQHSGKMGILMVLLVVGFLGSQLRIRWKKQPSPSCSMLSGLVLSSLFLGAIFATWIPKTQQKFQELGLPNLNRELRHFQKIAPAIWRELEVVTDYGWFRVLPDFRSQYRYLVGPWTLEAIKARAQSAGSPLFGLLIRDEGYIYDNVGPYQIQPEILEWLKVEETQGRVRRVLRAVDQAPEYVSGPSHYSLWLFEP
jgi:hypothetical protein